MDAAAVRKLLDSLTAGELDADEVVRRLRALPFTDMGYATLDSHRELRQGLPEAVYGPGKSAEHCVGIVGELLSSGDGPVVLSRASDEQVNAVTAAWPGAEVTGSTVVWRSAPRRAVDPTLVVTAGTADLAVACECEATLAAFGIPSRLIADVGVAGIHRLLARAPEIQRAPAVVVVAGMEGALASVIGGLTAAPVVAVPTSVGYGASLSGVTALLGMLSSCASGLVVVGIDNGFGAAFAVHRLLGARP
ncbi:MAG TPA: nickel pincer cofactor biosynthesis protein LarB [Acidimicrobiales bacterium]|nr:nickel pincer cofactor biosynthesis protein LarB [Acidimicrobiales bacterium]